MMKLDLYRSYIFDQFRYPSLNQIDYNHILAHNLRGCPTPTHFFKQLTELHHSDKFIFTSDLLQQFTTISQFQMESLDKYFWYEMPEFFNKSGEFYQLIYQNYAAAFVTHFQIEMANSNSTLMQHTFLYDFYQESAQIINKLTYVKTANNDELFIHQTVIITLLSIYVTIRTIYSNIMVNNMLNNSEIVSNLLPNYKTECNSEHTTSYYIKQLFTKASLMFSVDSNDDSRKPYLVDKCGNTIKMRTLKVGENRDDKLNVTESANYLNMTTKTVRRYTADNKLKKYMNGRKPYYLRGELLEFMNQMLH